MIRGILPALLTPMDDDGASVNHESLRRLVEFHIQSGASGFFVCGGTGEGLLLNPQERREVLATVVAAAGGRAKVIAHIGALDTSSACVLARQAAGSALPSQGDCRRLKARARSDGLLLLEEPHQCQDLRFAACLGKASDDVLGKHRHRHAIELCQRDVC